MMRRVATGLERLVGDPPSWLAAGRCGMLTNPTGVNDRLESAIDLLHAHSGITLTTLLGPEHGVRGDAQAGDHVSGGIDRRTGLPVYSLHGETRSPTAEMLDGIDILLVDLQDIGARFTTYISTVALVIDACAVHGKEVMILDRPNPLGGNLVAGNILEPAYTSFVGIHPIPIIHGLTLGEFALLYAADTGLPLPKIVTLDNWNPTSRYDDTGLPWIQPSPNLPTLDSVTAFPATCLLEGTVLSEGRGTTRPFELVGAPWLDADALAASLNSRSLDGVRFRAAWFTPSFSKHAGVRCGGVQLHVTDIRVFDAVRTGLAILEAARDEGPDHFAWIPPAGEHHFIDLLAGTSALRSAIDARQSTTDLADRWQAEADHFRHVRKPYLLYERR